MGWIIVVLDYSSHIKLQEYNARQCTNHTIIKNQGPDSVMVVGKEDKPTFYVSHHVTAITFLLIGIIIITTSISFVFPLTLNQKHIAMAQQEQLYTGVTMASAFLIFDLNSLPF
jgi:hypothetical protein